MGEAQTAFDSFEAGNEAATAECQTISMIAHVLQPLYGSAYQCMVQKRANVRAAFAA